MAHRNLARVNESSVVGRKTVDGRAKEIVVRLNEEVCGSKECVATLIVFSCGCFNGHPIRDAAAGRGEDTGRDGGAKTLEELGDPVKPRLGGGGRTDDLDARPGWVDRCDG